MILHTNPGEGETSYANNSLLQKTGILKSRPFLEETIKDMLDSSFPICFKFADLGCASGPNTFSVISNILDTIDGLCHQAKRKSPEFQVFLNDLPQNDFNSVFKSLPAFYQRLKQDKPDEFGPCFVSATPGSFYKRLFPRSSIHFVHSSYSLHWLSQVPENLENNKRNIYMAKSCPPSVYKAYLEQFQKDFSLFLSLRSEEIISGGRIFLILPGRSVAYPWSKDYCDIFGVLTKSLLELVDQGLVEEADVDSFNLPWYMPYWEEVRKIIQEQGSFHLDRLEILDDASDDVTNKEFVFDRDQSGRNFAKSMRAITEPLLTSHFGNRIIDALFARFAKNVAEHLAVEKIKGISLVVSITKK